MKASTLLALSLCIAVGLPAFAQRPAIVPADTCREIPLHLEEGKVWTISGAFTNPSELTLVDAINDNILRFDTVKGKYIGKQPGLVEKLIKRVFDDFHPAALASANGSTSWLQLTGGRFVELRDGVGVASTVDLWGTGLKDEAKLVAVLRWTLAGNVLYGYGNFRMANGELKTGFYRVNLKDRSDAHVIESYPETHKALIWYRLGYPYIATLGNTAYILRVDGELSLARVGRVKNASGYKLQELGALPQQLRNPPNLPRFTTPQDYVNLMDFVEHSTIPAGIYGWEGHLYILWREMKEGNQAWWLTKIDPRMSAPLSTARLPSSANHLMVIPGPKSWAIVEKGRVAGLGLQSLSRILLIPASEFTQLDDGETLCR